MKIHYSADGDMYDCDIEGNWFIHRAIEQKSIIELCADDYYANHDGVEDTWPIEFELYDAEDGSVLAKFKIELEYDPTFSAVSIL